MASVLRDNPLIGDKNLQTMPFPAVFAKVECQDHHPNRDVNHIGV
jgi:hypothetical protein